LLDAEEAAAAADAMTGRYPRVRVMPFLAGRPCGIHGIVLDDGVVALRPVEHVVVRTPGEPRLRLVGFGTVWDAPGWACDELRAVARRVGAVLAQAGHRSSFVVDGVLTADGFRATGWRPGWDQTIGYLDAALPDVPYLLLHHALAAGAPAGVPAAELEELLLSAGEGRRHARIETTLDERPDLPADQPLVRDGTGWREAASGAEPHGRLVVEPDGQDWALRIELDAERLGRGPSFAPRATELLNWLDRSHHTRVGEPTPAKDPRPRPTIRRSLSLSAPLRRMPHRMLREMLRQLPPDTPPDGPQGPVALLEDRIAGLLGKPAALFFPSGTMAQQVALRVHAERSGRHTFAGHPQTHLDVWEERGYAVVHGLRFHPVGDRNALMGTAELAAVGEPLAAVIWELPQRDIGGQLPSWHTLRDQVGWARDSGAAAHLDGARLWEAQTFYRRSFAEIAALFDTVYVSLYKSLEGVRGAVLAGDTATIAAAQVWRQRLGGGIRDAWPLAAAALVGLDDVLPRMAAFRDHAIAIAAAINADGTARTVPDPPQTPLFHVHLPASRPAAERAAAELLADHGVQLFTRPRTAPDPATCSFEVTVGENAMAFTPEEVVGHIRDLMLRVHSATRPRPRRT
jgi:threonine aldolase